MRDQEGVVDQILDVGGRSHEATDPSSHHRRVLLVEAVDALRGRHFAGFSVGCWRSKWVHDSSGHGAA
jgi:hypothetical protein